MNFQYIVLSIALVLLILVLIVFGISMYNKKATDTFPPVQSSCPDYWVEERGSDNEQYCVNDKGLGNSDCQKKINFHASPFVGSKAVSLCAKEEWAKNCNITWDGVTNNPDSCSSK
jgi:hypothetical protein